MTRVDKRLFWPKIFSKIEVSYFVVLIHIIKAICHSYQDYAQRSVCIFTVAMETPTNKVKMIFFYDLRHFSAVSEAFN